MLELREIAKIVDGVAKDTFTSRNFVRPIVEPAVDSVGNEALHVMIVIKPGAMDRVSGDAIFDTLTRIHDRLQGQGDERFPIIQYATEKDLKAAVDA